MNAPRVRYTHAMKQLMALGAAALLLIVAARPSFAQEEDRSASRKVILATMLSCCQKEAWFVAERRVAAELSQANFVVEVKDSEAKGEEERRTELGILAGNNKAACALRIVRPGGKGGAADLWIHNYATGKTTYRRVAFEGKDGDEDVSIFALRITEALRAALIELKIRNDAPSSRASEPAMLKEPQPIVRKEDSSSLGGTTGPFSVRLGAGAVGFPNEAGFLGTAALAVRGTFIPALSVELEGTTSFPGKHLGTGAADSTFGVSMVRAWVTWEVLQDGLFRPSVGIGGGLLVATAEGADSARFTGVTDRTSLSYVGANAQCAAAIWRRVWLRAGMSYGRSVPEVHISYGSAGTRMFGKPLIEGSAGVEVKIP